MAQTLTAYRPSRQTYILPIPDGWAVVTYGDEVIPDDTIVPLPLTSEASYVQAETLVLSLEIGSGVVDGWRTWDELCHLEPELARRVMGS